MDTQQRIDLLDDAIDTFDVMKRKAYYDSIRGAVDAGVELPDIDLVDKLELFEQECKMLRDALQSELDEEEEEEGDELDDMGDGEEELDEEEELKSTDVGVE